MNQPASTREINQAFVDEISNILWDMKIGERRVLERMAFPRTLQRTNFLRMLEYRGWVDGGNCFVRKLSVHPETGESFGPKGTWPLLVEKRARARKYTRQKLSDIVKSLEVESA